MAIVAMHPDMVMRQAGIRHCHKTAVRNPGLLKFGPQRF
jgi:hypothetical protein